MNAQRHSIPFREELGGMISTLSDSADTLEKWFKVLQLWTSLESVFTGWRHREADAHGSQEVPELDKD